MQQRDLEVVAPLHLDRAIVEQGAHLGHNGAPASISAWNWAATWRSAGGAVMGGITLALHGIEDHRRIVDLIGSRFAFDHAAKAACLTGLSG
jgi:hypothetical protein